MFADDENDAPEQLEFQEPMKVDEGVFRPGGGREAGCEPDEDRCAPSDFAEDEFADHGTPGTVDDVPNTMGVENPAPGDEHVVPVGDTRLGEASERGERDADRVDRGGADERELWRRQQGLVGEDETAGVKLEGVGEAEAAEIVDAMGDDAAEALPDWPEGTSATGAGGQPDHGGFPEREE